MPICIVHGWGAQQGECPSCRVAPATGSGIAAFVGTGRMYTQAELDAAIEAARIEFANDVPLIHGRSELDAHDEQIRAALRERLAKLVDRWRRMASHRSDVDIPNTMLKCADALEALLNPLAGRE